MQLLNKIWLDIASLPTPLIILIAVVLASWIYGALSILLPFGLEAGLQRIWTFGESSRRPVADFLGRLARFHQRLLPTSSVRLVLERQHAALADRLRKFRDDVDRKLKSMAALAGAEADSNLAALLQRFEADADRALEFGELEEGLSDWAVARRLARSRLRWSLIGSLFMAMLNGLMLYLFFSELDSGITIPFTEIDMLVVLTLLLPAGEFMTGFFSELYNDKEDTYLRNLIVKIVVLTGLAGFEYFIFFMMFKKIFEDAKFTEYNWIIFPLSIIGPGLTLLQATIGAGAGRALRTLSEAETQISIQEQTRRANAFVAGLPRRYTTISQAAQGASEAIEQLLADLEKKDGAAAPMAESLDEQRRLLVAAVDGVNPANWPTDAPASEDERWDMARIAWALPFGFAVTFAAFLWVMIGVLRRARIFAWDPAWLLGAAGGAGILCFIAGALIYNRIGVATEAGSETSDVMFPRETGLRIAGGTLLGTILTAIGGAAVIGGDSRGALVALMSSGLGIGLSVLGSYHDLLWRGAVFLALGLLALLPLVLEGLFNILRKAIAGLLCLIIGLLWGTSFIVGFPIIILYWLYRGGPLENAQIESSRAAGV